MNDVLLNLVTETRGVADTNPAFTDHSSPTGFIGFIYCFLEISYPAT